MFSRRMSFSDICISIISYGMVGLFSIACFLPFLYVFTYSITPFEEYLRNPMNFIPRQVNINAYIRIFEYKMIRTGYANTVFITLIGTAMHILLLVMTAYPLTKKKLKGRNVILTLFVLTMFFNGGMIPNYYLMRELSLINTLWSLILPGVLGAYSIILMKNFINEIPESLEEAAIIDGATEITVLFRIILPLCIPSIVTLSLFHAVAAWNSYFSAILYISKRSLWPLQLVLRELIIESGISEVNAVGDEGTKLTPFTLKMSAIMIATLPIMCVYPFLQKYFMKGLLLGGVKG